VLGARTTAWNGNVWYFILSQELIFWPKVSQKAEICIKNVKKITGLIPEWNPTADKGKERKGRVYKYT